MDKDKIEPETPLFRPSHKDGVMAAVADYCIGRKPRRLRARRPKSGKRVL